ncbi:MAG: L,D-transpeptidase family protein [Rhodospirillales bacterium]|jgi:L,D-peptidoglycan transpeptidase YkuD (ErfK/YbiS/YcfS/YnhG family)|nr:L,D-transpeptidase family protein [Rhodospirillales bacterium]
MDIRVTVGGDGAAWLIWRDRRVRCAIGRGGLERHKREGDGATPVGRWPLRRVFYRPDRRAAPPLTALPVAVIGEADGWCDDPGDAAYNRPVRLPYPARHERLWRDDGLYDLFAVLGYNDDPPLPGLGSAIFLHVARAGFAPTEGCVALTLADLEALLAAAAPGDCLAVEPPPEA